MSYRDPKPEELKDPLFERIWQTIKSWDINVPSEYGGYMGATGNHVCAIMDAATQEHPAGSGGAHHKWPTVRNRAEAEALGSPRKVGEDGASELKIGDVVLVEATISGISRLEDGQISSEDLLHLRVGNGRGSIVRRCVARPSSAPAGEQQKEKA